LEPSGKPCGLGYLRILEFDTGKKEIRVSTYSPYLSQFMTIPDTEAAFTLPLDDNERQNTVLRVSSIPDPTRPG
jgi:hypothetical protein